MRGSSSMMDGSMHRFRSIQHKMLRFAKSHGVAPQLAAGLMCILGGCAANALSLEILTVRNRELGFITNFFQLIFVVLLSSYGKWNELFTHRKIPLKEHALQVVLTFVTSSSYAIALRLGVSALILTIVRSGSLVANLVVGIVLFGRKVSLSMALCICSITIGILMATWKDNSSPTARTESQEWKYQIGVLCLVGSLFISSVLGLLQDKMFAKYGRHLWLESFFWNHLLSIPLTALMFGNVLIEQIPKLDSAQWFAVFVNASTQYFCVQGVYLTLSASSSLTLNVALTIRKVLSVLLSIWLFQHPFSLMQWMGSLIVILGSFWYSVGHIRYVVSVTGFLSKNTSGLYSLFTSDPDADLLSIHNRKPLHRLRGRTRMAVILSVLTVFTISTYLFVVYCGIVLRDNVERLEDPRSLLRHWQLIGRRNRPHEPWLQNRRFFFTANFFNSEDILPTLLHEWYKLIGYLGPENVYVSVYENGSVDRTPKILDELRQFLVSVGVPHRIGHESSKRPKGIDRIRYLAEKRNDAISPLMPSSPDYAREFIQGHESEVTVIFFNDIYLRIEDILELLRTNNGDFDMSCALDFYYEFYDRWVTRDRYGRLLSPDYPYFFDGASQQLVRGGEPVPVYSCWNGIVVFKGDIVTKDGIVFRDSVSLQPGLTKKFDDDDELVEELVEELRQNNGSFAKEGPICYHSECLLFCEDMRNLPSPRRNIFLNPRVRVAYSRWFYYWSKLILQPILDKLTDALHVVPEIEGPSPDDVLSATCDVKSPGLGVRLWAALFWSKSDQAKMWNL